MATYTYSEAVEQTITAGEQIHQIVNGTATTEVTVEDGSKVPSIRKTLLDNFYFKNPIAWQVGQTENVFNQLRQFTDGSWWYAPSATASNPVSMGSTPVGNSLWKVYDFDAIGKLTPQIRESLRRSYAEAGYDLIGDFRNTGLAVNSVTEVVLWEPTGIAYSYSGTLPHTIGAGETPVGNPSWVFVANHHAEYRPEMFGAIGDGVADDSDALDACFAAGTRICLYKNYRRTRPLAIVGGKRITAATPWVGRIYFDNCDAGTHTLVNRNDQAIWDGVSLLAISKGTKLGLVAIGNGLTNRLRPFIFRDCNFSGADLLQPDNRWPGELTSNIQEWNVDLRISDAAFSLVESCALTGKASARNDAWDTEATGLIVQDSSYVSLLNSKMLFRKYGYALVGSTEGFSDINNQIVDCYDGGTNQQHGGTIGPANGWVVKGGHCDCSHRGIIFGLNNDASVGGLHSIEGRLFLKRESGGVSGYKAIDLHTARSSVVGNIIQTNGTTLDYVGMGDAGIRIAGVENSVTGNIGRNPGTLVELTSTSQQNIVTGNRLSKAGTATSKLYSDAGTQNVLAANSYNSGAGAHRASTPTNQLLGAGSAYSIDVQSSGLAPNYDTRLDFIGGSAVDASGTLTIRVAKLNTTAADTNVNIIRPNATNTYTCGTASLAWSGMFTQTAPTITSDERCKTPPVEITDAMLDAAADVDWVLFQYLDRVEEKGPDKARWHFGAIAQRFVEAFERHGLDPYRFAFICYDEWGAEGEVVGEDGEVISPAFDAGSRYGIRYEQAIVLKQKQIERDHKRQIDALVERIEALEHK